MLLKILIIRDLGHQRHLGLQKFLVSFQTGAHAGVSAWPQKPQMTRAHGSPCIHANQDNMVVSLNRGTLIYNPKYYSSYYGDPQFATPNFWKPPYRSCDSARPKMLIFGAVEPYAHLLED